MWSLEEAGWVLCGVDVMKGVVATTLHWRNRFRFKVGGLGGTGGVRVQGLGHTLCKSPHKDSSLKRCRVYGKHKNTKHTCTLSRTTFSNSTEHGVFSSFQITRILVSIHKLSNLNQIQSWWSSQLGIKTLKMNTTVQVYPTLGQQAVDQR